MPDNEKANAVTRMEQAVQDWYDHWTLDGEDYVESRTILQAILERIRQSSPDATREGEERESNPWFCPECACEYNGCCKEHIVRLATSGMGDTDLLAFVMEIADAIKSKKV